MNARQTVKAIIVIGTSLVYAACGTVASPEDLQTGSSSVTLDFPGISSDLRKNLKLVYNLSCAKEKSGLRAATPITAIDESPDPAKVSLKFKASEVVIDSWCALEVMAEKPAELEKSTYRWLSKQKKVGLFYASEAGQVSKARRLDLTMHVLYEDSVQLDLTIDVSTKFVAMAVTDVEKANLVCGGVSYPSESANDSSFKFKLVKSDFAAGQKCIVRITQDFDNYDSGELNVKSDVATYTAEFTLDESELRVVTKEGSKCAYDTETMECAK